MNVRWNLLAWIAVVVLLAPAPALSAAQLPQPVAVPGDLPARERSSLNATRDALVLRAEKLQREIDDQRRGCGDVDPDDAATIASCKEWSRRIVAEYTAYSGAVDAFKASVLRESARRAKTGKPVLTAAECKGRKAARDRLAGGLAVQEEAIRRTEAQLDAAKKGIAEASAEKRRVLLDGAVQEAQGYATDVLTSARSIRSQVDLLKELRIDKAKRDMLIRSLNTAIFEGEGIAKAAQAGFEGGEDLRKGLDNLSGRILPLADKLLVESGIAEKVGEELSGTLGGPLGELAFRGARLSIDFTVALGKGMIGESELARAQANLGTMRTELDRARARVSALDRELSVGCRGQGAY